MANESFANTLVVEVEDFKKALQGVDGDERVRREMFANVDRAFEQVARAR